MCLCIKWGWCDKVVEWVSCVCIWSEYVLMKLLTECHVFVYEIRMMRWCCWVSVMCLSMKWGWCDDVVEWVSLFVYDLRMMWWSCWVSVMCLCIKCGFCDDVVEWVSCVFEWSEDDVIKLLSECHVFVYKVWILWWSCWMSVMCFLMKWGWCDDVDEWVSCVCGLSEDDVMMLMSEWHVFVD